MKNLKLDCAISDISKTWSPQTNSICIMREHPIWEECNKQAYTWQRVAPSEQYMRILNCSSLFRRVYYGMILNFEQNITLFALRLTHWSIATNYGIMKNNKLTSCLPYAKLKTGASVDELFPKNSQTSLIAHLLYD